MASPTRIDVIVFDVGGTLIDPWPSVGHVYATVAWRFGVTQADPDRLNARFQAAWQEKETFDYSRPAWQRLVEQAFHGVAGREQVGRFFPALYDHFAEAETWRIYEDVLPSLSGLTERGYRLAALSNWDERLHPLLDRLGLSPWFEVILSSHEIGATKPDRVMFQEMETRLQCEPERLLMVGDSRLEDWEGAGRAGWKRVLLRRGSHAGEGVCSDLRWLATGLAEAVDSSFSH